MNSNSEQDQYMAAYERFLALRVRVFHGHVECMPFNGGVIAPPVLRALNELKQALETKSIQDDEMLLRDVMYPPCATPPHPSEIGTFECMEVDDHDSIDKSDLVEDGESSPVVEAANTVLFDSLFLGGIIHQAFTANVTYSGKVVQDVAFTLLQNDRFNYFLPLQSTCASSDQKVFRAWMDAGFVCDAQSVHHLITVLKQLLSIHADSGRGPSVLVEFLKVQLPSLMHIIARVADDQCYTASRIPTQELLQLATHGAVDEATTKCIYEWTTTHAQLFKDLLESDLVRLRKLEHCFRLTTTLKHTLAPMVETCDTVMERYVAKFIVENVFKSSASPKAILRLAILLAKHESEALLDVKKHKKQPRQASWNLYTEYIESFMCPKLKAAELVCNNCRRADCPNLCSLNKNATKRKEWALSLDTTQCVDDQDVARAAMGIYFFGVHIDAYRHPYCSASVPGPKLPTYKLLSKLQLYVKAGL